MIQSGSEVVQSLHCDFDLYTQHAQVAIVGLWLDLNWEYTNSQDNIP